MTDAFNTFIQQSLNVEGLPFIVTKNSKEALREQAVAIRITGLICKKVSGCQMAERRIIRNGGTPFLRFCAHYNEKDYQICICTYQNKDARMS